MAHVRALLCAAAVGSLVLVAACGGESKKPKKAAEFSGPRVAWISAQPSLVVARRGVSTPCHGSDLQVKRQVTFVPRLEGGIALVELWNIGSRVCRLTGRPAVSFVHKGGPIQIDRKIAKTSANFPEVVYPPSTITALRPGEPAAVTVTWDNWCDPVVKGKPHVPPSAMRVTLPGGRGHVDADYNAVPPCVQPSQPSIIGVSAFEPSVIRATDRPWTEAYFRATVPAQPVRARRGGVLHFVVVLKNLSKTTAVFDRCPAYVQQLVPAGKVEVYNLNCAGAHPIRPGGSEAFAMQVRVPALSPVGRNGLFWELDPFGRQGPQVHADVVIRR
jgi:hypothetical protein